MKKAASVFLRAEITKTDIDNLISWLENESVTEYLEDGLDSIEMLRELSDDINEHLYSMKLSNGGMFYIIDGAIDDDDVPEPVGFVRLDEYAHRRYELVFAVGREDLWGYGIGSAAVRDALSKVFFDFRADSIRALVRRENSRSARVLIGCGFLPGYNGGRLMEYTLSFREYLRYLQKLQAM